MISSGFNLLGISEHLTLALWGITLLVVMAVKRVAAIIKLSRFPINRI
jgi:ribose/xylose/arabinose/galactoside ABC-type transport system permease subunit